MCAFYDQDSIFDISTSESPYIYFAKHGHLSVTSGTSIIATAFVFDQHSVFIDGSCHDISSNSFPKYTPVSSLFQVSVMRLLWGMISTVTMSPRFHLRLLNYSLWNFSEVGWDTYWRSEAELDNYSKKSFNDVV